MMKLVPSNPFCPLVLLVCLLLNYNSYCGVFAQTSTSSESSESSSGSASTVESGGSSSSSSSTEYYYDYVSSTSKSAEQQHELTPEEIKLADCNTSPDIVTYCNSSLPRDIVDYFGEHTTVMGMLATIIQPQVIYELQHKCTPGTWCLDDVYEKNISSQFRTFYNGTVAPYCTNDYWKCLEGMELRRKSCNENELFYHMSVIGALCDMEEIENFISTECFTRSVESFSVLYADLSRTNYTIEDTQECTDYNKAMINTLGCTMEACTLEQRVFLQDFGPWLKLTSHAMALVEKCGINMKCDFGYTAPAPKPTPTAISPVNNNSKASEKEKANSTNATSGNVTQTQSSNSNVESESSTNNNAEAESEAHLKTTQQTPVSTTDQKSAEQLQKQLDEMNELIESEGEIKEIVEEVFGGATTTMGYGGGSDSNGVDGAAMGDNDDIFQENDMDSATVNDQTFMYGMITVTAVVIISLTLIGVMALKRFNRIRNYKLGYSQMSEEECRMLKNEYH